MIGPNEKIIKTAKGICSNRCVIYHSRCAFCQKAYVGKATQRLNRRVNGHRSKFYECLYYDGDRQDIGDDDHLLGMTCISSTELENTLGLMSRTSLLYLKTVVQETLI